MRDATPTKRATKQPKQKVLRHFPDAICYRDKLGRYVISTTRIIGGGDKERAAWIDAASRLA